MSRGAAFLQGQVNETKIQVNFFNQFPFVTLNLSDFDFEFLEILEVETKFEKFAHRISK